MSNRTQSVQGGVGVPIATTSAAAAIPNAVAEVPFALRLSGLHELAIGCFRQFTDGGAHSPLIRENPNGMR
jgi:hypothetical protein